MARFDLKQRQFLIAKLGLARVLQLESDLPAFSKALELAGVAWKGAQQQAAGQHSASPAAPYVSDLMRRRPPSTEALKEITDSSPVGVYLADVAAGLVTRGEG